VGMDGYLIKPLTPAALSQSLGPLARPDAP
jgi:hypothetical protein